MRDMATVTRWRNDPELIKTLGAPFRYINPETDQLWFENYMKNRGRAVRLAICTEDDDSILGLTSLLDIDPINQSCTFHIMVGQENQGKGAGTFGLHEIIRHGFLNLNLRRIELEVLETNSRGIHIYEKMGFVYEGRRRQAIYKQGRFQDILIYSLLRDEFLA